MDKAFTIFINHGYREYDNNVSYLEYATKSALLAEKYCIENNIHNLVKNDLIIASFLKNIGFLLKYEYPANNYILDENNKVKDHEFIGSEYLLSLGYNRIISELIKKCGETERYLISTNKKYYTYLSKYVNNHLNNHVLLMTPEQIKNFEYNNLFEYHLKIREWCNLSKIINKDELIKIKNIDVINYFYHTYVTKINRL